MLNVTVISTIELTSDQFSQVKKAVEKKYGKEVTFVQKIDSSLIGGVQLVIGSRLLDGSIKNKILQLRSSALAV